ncbi:MAG: Cna B-type domain-containing protein [Clostridia bacterium]|nr:Cna B-type domain-containing protein [Clostridia bacterium]
MITITAAIIIFCTTYALILPAITLENVFCGIEEHVHDASCYVQITEQDVLVLDCNAEKLGVHAHTDECYNGDGETVCGYSDFVVHQHTNDCFDGDNLVCKLPAVSAHVHDDSCYLNNDKESKLLCGYKEIVLHEHTEECFDGDELICGSVETLKHIHNEDCFSVSSEKVDSKKLYCQLAVGANHQHNELCFGLWELSCGKDTHIHGASCRANDKSDVETREEYEKTLEQVELSGNWREDILSIAQTQLGYSESKKNYVVAEDGTTLNGYTRYGAWFGDEFGDEYRNEYRNEYGEWSGMFIAFCLNYAGVDDEDMPYDNNFERWVYELKEEKLYHKIESHYETKIGDVVFFDNDKYDKNKTDKRIADRVGFVSELLYNEDGELNGIKTIEGDLNGCVDKNAYELDDETIIGFSEIPKRKNKAPECDCGMSEAKLEEHSGLCERKAFARALSNENNAEQLYNIWLTIPEDVKAMLYTNLESDTLTELNALIASIPEINEKTTSVDGLDFSLTGPFGDMMEPNVSEIDKDALDGLKEYLKDTDEHLFSGAYDICVVDGDEKAEFENPIQVAIAGLGVSNINPKYLRVKVYHLVGVDENDVSPLSEHTEVEVMEAEIDDDGNLCFETDDFSVFYFTVDFHYEDITFKIDGYSSIELSKLFDELELPFDAADAKSVTFSNEKYVSVSQMKDDDGNVTDWLLTSNEPFTSTETLKIEFNDGTKLELEVTDEQTPVMEGGADTTVSVNISGMANDREVVVNLLNNGVPTGQSMILNSANSFKGSFTNLPQGSYSVEYTDFDDYMFGLTTNKTDGVEWVEVDNFTNGKTYVLVHSSTRAVQNSSSDDLSRSSSLSISNGKITSNVSNAMKWYYNGYLQNVNTSRYLRLTSSGAATHASTAENFSYTSSGYIRQDSSTTRYLRYSSYYRQTTSTSSATAFTLYEERALTTEITYTLYAEQTVYNPEGDINSFEHNKTIDDLSDGATNPDTSLLGDDFYRLYLDMTGKSEPIDLLLVVDGSSSMDDEDMEGGMRRDEALMEFLNGSTSRVTDDGFIPYFLGLNDQNNVAVVQFYGLVDDVGFDDDAYISTENVDYTHDSAILLDWTSSLTKFVDCTCKTRSGTNYEAGLIRATEVLSSTEVRNNGHRKVMVFLSDGVPTLYQINVNDIGNVGLNDYVISPDDVGKRYAEGLASYYQYNRDPSMVAFDDFMKANPGITVFTVGVSEDINAENTETSQSPDVLQYMATNGNGEFYSVYNSMAELKLQLESLFYPQGVTITDELSKYVRYYSEQPDVKVTMTHNETGETTVLYQNGAVTAAGRDILTSVTYTAGDTSIRPTASTGKVTAVFNSEYEFLPEYTYTLSFNVQNTQTGYEEIANTGSYNAVGDQNTDYGSNNTSSGKEGFYSNDDATVKYLISGTQHEDKYAHPVVQVSTESLIVKKEWIDSLEPDEHDSIEVALILKHTVDGVTTETQVGQTVFLDSENGWQHIFTGLPKQHFVSPDYEYTVQEVEVPSGYSATYELTEDENGVLTWIITNTQDNGKIVIQKVDAFGNPIKLEGISFELYEDAGLTNQFGERYFTDENGQIVIEGISTDKTYWLVERTPPAGYKVMASSQKITFTEGKIDEVELVGNKYLSVGADGTLIVKNYPGYELPETGGIGTIVIGAIGIMLITAVVVLAYVTKHKKKRVY